MVRTAIVFVGAVMLLSLACEGFLFQSMEEDLAPEPDLAETEEPECPGLCWPVDLEPDDANTVVRLPSARYLTLNGKWSPRERFWEGRALLFTSWFSLWLLDGNEKTPRRIAGSHKGFVLEGPEWSSADRTAFLWIDILRGLVSVKLDDPAGAHSVFNLPVVPNDDWYWFRPGLLQENRGCGVLESSVLVLAQEEVDDESGVWLYTIARTPGKETLRGHEEVQRRWIPTTIGVWDLDPIRERLYWLDGDFESLEVRDLQGELIERIEVPEETWGFRVSPDGTRLVFERGQRDGFSILDLDSKTLTAGPEDGYAPSWAPDSRRLAYLRDWELWLLDLDTGESEQIVFREPSQPDVDPLYWTSPAWSPDGRCLAAAPGGNDDPVRGLDDIHTIVLDLEKREFVVWPEMPAEHMLVISRPRQ